MMTIFSDAKNENTKAQINKAVDQLESYHQQISQTESAIQDVHNKIREILDRMGNMQEDLKSMKHGYEQLSTDLGKQNIQPHSKENEVTLNENIFG